MKILVISFFISIILLNSISYELEINAGILIGDGFDDITFSISYNLLNRAGI